MCLSLLRRVVHTESVCQKMGTDLVSFVNPSLYIYICVFVCVCLCVCVYVSPAVAAERASNICGSVQKSYVCLFVCVCVCVSMYPLRLPLSESQISVGVFKNLIYIRFPL